MVPEKPADRIPGQQQKYGQIYFYSSDAGTASVPALSFGFGINSSFISSFNGNFSNMIKIDPVIYNGRVIFIK